MAKFRWEWNNEKTRWEIVYYGRKVRKPIFECKGDRTKTASYSPIIDYPQSSLCGGYGKALLDGRPCVSYSVWRDICVQVLGPEKISTIGAVDALDARIIINRANGKQEVIYIGLPPE